MFACPRSHWTLKDAVLSTNEQVNTSIQTEPMKARAAFSGSIWIDWRFLPLNTCRCLSLFEDSTSCEKTSLINKKASFQKRFTNHNKLPKANHNPWGWVSWFPMYHIYIGLCVSLSMPMVKKQRLQEPSNLSLMESQLKWHCSHSQTIKVSLWVFNMISFITPVWGLGGCLDKIQCPSWKRSKAACC